MSDVELNLFEDTLQEPEEFKLMDNISADVPDAPEWKNNHFCLCFHFLYSLLSVFIQCIFL